VFDDVFAAAGERLEDHLTLIPQPVWRSIVDGWRQARPVREPLPSQVRRRCSLQRPRSADGIPPVPPAVSQVYTAFDT
jgi:hypothetical protein